MHVCVESTPNMTTEPVIADVTTPLSLSTTVQPSTSVKTTVYPKINFTRIVGYFTSPPTTSTTSTTPLTVMSSSTVFAPFSTMPVSTIVPFTPSPFLESHLKSVGEEEQIGEGEQKSLNGETVVVLEAEGFFTSFARE